MSVVKILDKHGQPLQDTTRNGMVRRLLKDKKARVVNDCPFTIQLIADDILEDNQMSINKQFTTEELQKFIMNIGRDELFDEKDGKLDYLVEGQSIFYRQAVMNTLKALGYDPTYVATVVRYAYDNEYNKPKKVLSPLSVKLSEEIMTEGHVVICGQPGQGKTFLCKNIAHQMSKRGMQVTYASKIPVVGPDDSVNLIEDGVTLQVYDVSELAKNIDDIECEMVRRLKLMEEQNVNSFDKLLKGAVKPIVLIIDSLDDYKSYGHSYDPKLSEVKDKLAAIIRLGRAAGILVIITCQSPDNVPSALYDNFHSKIIVGKIPSMKARMHHLPENLGRGLGVYYNDVDDNWQIFATNPVADYK